MNQVTDVWAALRALGTDFTPAQIVGTQQLFAPLVARPDPAHCLVARDLAYGPDARHRLDVFRAPGATGATRPVLVFVHGGGFVQGDKGGEAAPFYNNVGAWAVAQGFVGVTVTYRLAPAHPWPAGAQDLQAAVAWLNANVGGFGGDPSRIVLMGQSAGAAHVAGYLARHGSGDAASSLVAGAVLVSGIYDIEHAESNDLHRAYYGADASLYRERSSVHALAKTNVPCLFSVSELDPPQFHKQAAAAVNARVAQVGAWPEVLYLAGHNHISSVLQMGSKTDTLGPALLSFMGRRVGIPG